MPDLIRASDDRTSHWEVPAGEPPFTHHGERWQYVRCWHHGRQVTGYLRAADDMVYRDFLPGAWVLALP